MLARLKNGKVASAWTAWAAATVQFAREENLLKKTVRRMRMLRVASVFDAWTERTQTQKRLRTAATRVVKRWTQQRLVRTFNAWVDLVERNQQQRMIDAHANQLLTLRQQMERQLAEAQEERERRILVRVTLRV